MRGARRGGVVRGCVAGVPALEVRVARRACVLGGAVLYLAGHVYGGVARWAGVCAVAVIVALAVVAAYWGVVVVVVVAVTVAVAVAAGRRRRRVWARVAGGC